MEPMTGDGIVELIETSDRPFVGTGEIAEHFDVTQQAVRVRREEFRHHPDLAVSRLGKLTVFHLDRSEGRDETETHRMAQMDAQHIAGIALGIAAVGGVISQVSLPLIALILAGLVGVALIAYGISPLVGDRPEAPQTGTPEVVANE